MPDTTARKYWYVIDGFERNEIMHLPEDRIIRMRAAQTRGKFKQLHEITSEFKVGYWRYFWTLEFLIYLSPGHNTVSWDLAYRNYLPQHWDNIRKKYMTLRRIYKKLDKMPEPGTVGEAFVNFATAAGLQGVAYNAKMDSPHATADYVLCDIDVAGKVIDDICAWYMEIGEAKARVRKKRYENALQRSLHKARLRAEQAESPGRSCADNDDTWSMSDPAVAPSASAGVDRHALRQKRDSASDVRGRRGR